MQSSGVLADGLVKSLALDLGNLELLGRGLTAAVGGGKGTGTPGGATVDLGQVGQLGKGVGVAQGDVDDAVVGEGGQGGDGGGLLAAAEGGGGDEEAGELAVEGTLLPLGTGVVPEGLPLGGEVSVPGGDTDQEGIVLGQLGWVVEDGDVRWLGGSVHLGQDFLREGLGNPILREFTY